MRTVPFHPPLGVRLLAVAVALSAGCGGEAASPDAGAVEDSPGAAERAPVGWSEPAWPEGTTAGAVVYVPVYSHIYYRDATRRIELAATLSVRNTDPERPVTVASVAYYDSDGHPVREYLDRPLVLGPLGTRSFVVEEHDQTGGSGANFLVTWSSEEAVSEPLIEGVMISTASSQGLSFVGEGRTIRQFGAEGGATARR